MPCTETSHHHCTCKLGLPDRAAWTAWQARKEMLRAQGSCGVDDGLGRRSCKPGDSGLIMASVGMKEVQFPYLPVYAAYVNACALLHTGRNR